MTNPVHVFVVENATPSEWDKVKFPPDSAFSLIRHDFVKIRDHDTFNTNLSLISSVVGHAIVLLDLNLEIRLEEPEQAALNAALNPIFSSAGLSQADQLERQNLQRVYAGLAEQLNSGLYFLLRLLETAKWDGLVFVCSNTTNPPAIEIIRNLSRHRAADHKLVVSVRGKGSLTANPQQAITEAHELFQREFDLLHWYLHPPPLGEQTPEKDVSWLEPRLIGGKYLAHNIGDSHFSQHWEGIIAAFPRLKTANYQCLKPIVCAYDSGGVNNEEVPLEVLGGLLEVQISLEDVYSNTMLLDRGVRFPVNPAFPFILALRQWLHGNVLQYHGKEPVKAILVTPFDNAAILAIRPEVIPVELAAKIGNNRETNVGDFAWLLLQACKKSCRPTEVPARASNWMLGTLGMPDDKPCAFPWITPFHIGIGWTWGKP